MSWTINEQSKTSETQYFDASYATSLSLPSSLSTVANSLLLSVTTNPIIPNNITASNIPPSSTSGTGGGAIFTISVAVAAAPVTGITAVGSGSGYVFGDTITFSQADLASFGFGSPATDLVYTLVGNDFTTNKSLLESVTTQPVIQTASPFGLDFIPTSLSGIGTGLSVALLAANGSPPSPAPITGIIVIAGGQGYAVGDQLQVPEATLNSSAFGAGTTGNLDITLTSDNFATNGVGGIIVVDNTIADSVAIDVAGYTAGTISFSLGFAPDGGAWAAGSTLKIRILGGIDVNSFVTDTLTITEGDTNSTFYVDWSIPLKTVVLRIDNNTTISTGIPQIINSIRMMTESNGGGLGYVSTSGTSVGPGGSTPQMQFNDGGIFGGASGALYDKNANTNTGQVQLANGSAANPMLAFSDGTHPTGNYDTGIYRADVNDIGFSVGGVAKVGILDADSGDFIEGLNVGIPGNIAGIRRLSATAKNSWEDGHLGNSVGIYFTPQDFSSDSLTTVYTPTSTQSIRGVIRNRPWVGVTDGDTLVNACKLIPKGFVITEDSEITIFTAEADGTGGIPPRQFRDITGTDINVYTQTLTTGLGAAYNGQQLLQNLSYTTNAPISITTAMSGTSPPNGLTYLVISWNPGQQLDTTTANPGLYGAYLTMTRI